MHQTANYFLDLEDFNDPGRKIKPLPTPAPRPAFLGAPAGLLAGSAAAAAAPTSVAGLPPPPPVAASSQLPGGRSPAPDAPLPAPRGLTNGWNECGWNTLLQGYLAAYCPAMLEVLSADAQSDAEDTALLANCTLDALFQLIRLDATRDTPVESLFTSACQAVFPQFAPDRQHDVAELQAAVLGKLPGLQALFSGRSFFKTTCATCKTPRESNIEPFDIVHVPLGGGGTNLAEAVNGLLLPSPLYGPNQQHCVVCGGKCDGEQALVMETAPAILCLQMLRFTGWRHKDKQPVYYDDVLAADVLFHEEFLLRAALSHHGRTRDSGHYTGRVFDARCQKWVTCDDEHVNIAADAHDNDMYLLMYQVCFFLCFFFSPAHNIAYHYAAC